jgi:hypothetical protein
MCDPEGEMDEHEASNPAISDPRWLSMMNVPQLYRFF